MKIFLIASECPPVAGGIATYVGNTASMFADAGHDITVFTRSDQPGVEQKGLYRRYRKWLACTE
jgi:CTP:molybdopterin cytidylyltransferase MocA